MRAKQAIKVLQAVMKEHGNVEVYVQSSGKTACFDAVGEVRVLETGDTAHFVARDTPPFHGWVDSPHKVYDRDGNVTEGGR